MKTEITTGVAVKNLDLKKKLISYFANTGNATINDLCKELNLSAPKVTALISELIEAGSIKEYGKVESSGGRRASLYGLASDSGYFLGVEVRKNFISIGLLDFKKELFSIEEKIPFQLSNTQESLDELCSIVLKFIEALPFAKEKILGLGLSLPGRINSEKGLSYNNFHFNDQPLSKTIESQIGIRTLIENDSRSMAYGEFCLGTNDEKNVLFINLDHGIGMAVLINGQLYYGKSGYAGEFGHIPYFNNEILCHCGKKGCLETEASGHGLVRIFQKKLREGSSSVAAIDKNPEQVELEDILTAATNDDVMAIELLAETGEKIGRAVASLINIFNPELVILGGAISNTGNLIQFPIKSAINKYSLSLVTNDTQFKLSELGTKAGVIGASLLARNMILLN